MAGLGYICIGTSDFDRARAFYDTFFGALGGREVMPAPAGIVFAFASGSAVMLARPYDGQPARPGNGTMAAFKVDRSEDVASLHALALSLGGTDEGAPGPRGHFGDFAYFRDLDGNKLAVYCREKKAG